MSEQEIRGHLSEVSVSLQQIQNLCYWPSMFTSLLTPNKDLGVPAQSLLTDHSSLKVQRRSGSRYFSHHPSLGSGEAPAFFCLSDPYLITCLYFELSCIFLKLKLMCNVDTWQQGELFPSVICYFQPHTPPDIKSLYNKIFVFCKISLNQRKHGKQKVNNLV